MTSIMTYKPWGDVARFDQPEDPWEEMMRGFFVRPVGVDGRAADRTSAFKMDVFENEESYRVIAELPGAKKEDIAVTVDGATVTVTAEVRREREAGTEEQQLWSERYHGKLQRAFTLEREVDQERAQASYADGVLSLTLPKSTRALGKRISVQ